MIFDKLPDLRCDKSTNTTIKLSVGTVAGHWLPA